MITTLVFSIAPVCIALVGNFYEKEIAPKKLIFPLCLIFLGIFLAKFREFDPFTPHIVFYLLGIFFGLVGLGAWTWFVVINSRFLKNQKVFSVTEWTCMMGTCTFFLVLILVTLTLPFTENPGKYLIFSLEIQEFFSGSLVLGIICTWIPFFLWNHGCKKIPVSLSGQLISFEIFFTLSLIYLLEGRLPYLSELIGVFFVFSGIFLSLKSKYSVNPVRES
jgi:drug/metabolite transporter (DMT)-like permease